MEGVVIDITAILILDHTENSNRQQLLTSKEHQEKRNFEQVENVPSGKKQIQHQLKRVTSSKYSSWLSFSIFKDISISCSQQMSVKT